MRLSAGALEGVGGGYYTTHTTPLSYTPLPSTCTARCIHVLGQTHVSTHSTLQAMQYTLHPVLVTSTQQAMQYTVY